MVEIHLQKKKRPIWPWILGLILAVLLVLFFVLPFSDGEIPPPLTPVGDTIVNTPPEVFEYIAFAQNGIPENERIEAWASEGIKKLSLAVSGIAQASGTYNNEIAVYKSNAWNASEQILSEKNEEKKSELARSAFIATSDALRILKRKEFGHLEREIFNLRLSAELFDPNIFISNQTEAIDVFFKEAAAVLQTMAMSISN
jgi:hypothetical protein